MVSELTSSDKEAMYVSSINIIRQRGNVKYQALTSSDKEAIVSRPSNKEAMYLQYEASTSDNTSIMVR